MAEGNETEEPVKLILSSRLVVLAERLRIQNLLAEGQSSNDSEEHGKEER
jgi:hypothetical protein